MAIRGAILTGTTPLGAPIVGWVADHIGPRWALGVGAASGFAAALVAIHYLIKHRRLHLHVNGKYARFSIDNDTRNPPS